MTLPLYGGIEAGGTKFVCAVGRDEGDDAVEILAETRFPTSDDPDAVLGEAIRFFRAQQESYGPLAALGVASFGPLDLDRGVLTTTPKPGWAQTPLVAPLREALDLPVGLETDVAGAALAEHRWGAGRGVKNLVYVTIGTGIGGGILIDGRPVRGLIHPEMGHAFLPRRPDDQDFAGVCPFHGGACLEGLASGPALRARWGRPAEDLPPDHPAWDLQAFYLGTFAANLALTLSPQRLIFGGGVAKAPGLLEKTRARLVDALAGYLAAPEILEQVDHYLVAPELGGRAGVLGAILLARHAETAAKIA